MKVEMIRRSGPIRKMRALLAAVAVSISSLWVGSLTASASHDTPKRQTHAAVYFTCDYLIPTKVSAFCATVRTNQLKTIAAVNARAQRLNTPVNPGCNANFTTIEEVRGGDNGTLSSQLDLVNPYGTGGGNKYWFCYYFIGGGDDNDPDFDDFWQVYLRVWVCGGLKQQASPEGTGPPVAAESNTWWYGPGCNPQADDNNSYAVVDGSKVYFPYVHF